MIQILDWISQFFIFTFGCAAIWFVGRKEKWMRWGYVFGLLSEPFWIYTIVAHQQFVILPLTLWYTYSWGQGFYNYWIRRDSDGI